MEVVELLPGVGIKFLQLGTHQGAGEVVGNQAADDAGLDDVLAHLCQAFVGWFEIPRQNIAAHQAVLDHLDKAHVGGKDGIDLRAVNARQEENGVGDLAQQGEKFGREHVAVTCHHRHGHAVGAAELFTVFEEGMHVIVLDRQKLRETGVHAQPRGQPGQHHRDHYEEGERQEAAAEDQTVDECSDRMLPLSRSRFLHQGRLFDFGEGFDAEFSDQHHATAIRCQGGRHTLA